MITATSEYALRALVQLAQLPKGEMARGKELSEQQKIPANYLSKVLLTLAKAGLVEATRGYGGGYKLGKPARDIPLVDVVELFEGIHTRPHCFLGEDHVCADDEACGAHEHFRAVRVAYIRFLERTTIDIVAKAAAKIDLERANGEDD